MQCWGGYEFGGGPTNVSHFHHIWEQCISPILLLALEFLSFQDPKWRFGKANIFNAIIHLLYFSL